MVQKLEKIGRWSARVAEVLSGFVSRPMSGRGVAEAEVKGWEIGGGQRPSSDEARASCRKSRGMAI